MWHYFSVEGGILGQNRRMQGCAINKGDLFEEREPSDY
jgi:hypothetical protein